VVIPKVSCINVCYIVNPLMQHLFTEEKSHAQNVPATGRKHEPMQEMLHSGSPVLPL
jgi:hypothetical protein